MAVVLNFRGHHWVGCDADCRGCLFCKKRLQFCDRCCGAEGTLTTHCPGRRMSDRELDLVWDGQVDYDERRGGWYQKKGDRCG